MVIPTNHQNILEEKNKVNVKKKQKLINQQLRGGGCGSSVQDKITNQFSEKINLPYDFLEILTNNCDILIKKANLLVSGSNSLTHVMLAIQWFHYNAEYIDVCAQRGDYVKQAFDLFLNQAEGILRVVPNYIRSQGFIAYRILQIINELLRVVFSFQQKNKQSLIDEAKKESLLELIENIKSELEVQSAEIWKTGVDYELTLIEIMLHNCNINHSIGKGKLVDFLKNLVVSTCSLEIKEELLQNIFDICVYLFTIAYDQFSYPKEQYLLYYYFKTLTWKIIQAINQNFSIRSQIKKMIEKYGASIKNSNNWMAHYCWVQMICDLLSYRAVKVKHQTTQNASTNKPSEIQGKWNYLIQNNIIKILPFNKNSGAIQLFSNISFNHLDLRSEFQQSIEKFSLFCDCLMHEKLQNEYSIWDYYSNFSFDTKRRVPNGNDEAHFIKQKTGSEILVILKDQLIKNYKIREEWIDTIKIIFSNSSNTAPELDFTLLQDEVKSATTQLWNCIVNLVYILTEMYEKIVLVFKQIQILLIQSESDGFKDEDKNFQSIGESMTTLENQLKSFILKLQSDQKDCLNTELRSYDLLITNNGNFLLFQSKEIITETQESNKGTSFQQFVKTISCFISQEEMLSKQIFSYEMEKKKSKGFQITFQSLRELLESLTSQSITVLYTQNLLHGVEIINKEKELEECLLEAKQKMSFLQIQINLNRIFFEKLIKVLQNLEIQDYQTIKAQNESQKLSKENSKSILIMILENSKNLLQMKTQVELNEKYMLQKVNDLQVIINLNMKKFASRAQQPYEQIVSQIIHQVADLQNFIRKFYKASQDEKEKIFQQIIETVNKQLNLKAQHNEEESQTNQNIEKQNLFESFQYNFLRSEKAMKELHQMIEQVFIHLQTEIIIGKTQEQVTEEEDYSSLFAGIRNQIKNETEQIKKNYENIFQELQNQYSEKLINLSNLNFILNGFCSELDQQFNIDKQYLDFIKIIHQIKEEGLAYQSCNDYKVREALIMNLMKVQACVQEDEIMKFVQWQ